MKTSSWLAGMALVLASAGALAQTPGDPSGIRFTGAGFLTLAAGKVLGGTPDNPQTNPRHLGYGGPHYIADWSKAGVYESGAIRFKPDTRLGLQGSAELSPRFSLTGQIVAHGADDGKPDLEWFYGSWKASDKLTLQFGRKRLPILYYSESQDVGLSYPWLHLPPDLYGWQVVNYNGANARYRDQIADWTYVANVFAGHETHQDAGYMKLYNGKNSRSNVRWSRILGGELNLSRDWFEVRLGYFQNEVENGIANTGNYRPKFLQRTYTLGFMIDWENWRLANEYYVGDLSRAEEMNYAQVYALGYRLGRFTPSFTYSHYATRYVVGGPLHGYTRDDEERHDTRSLTLRYDLTSTSALKIQLDDYQDRSGPRFIAAGSVATGKVRLLSLGYDLVF